MQMERPRWDDSGWPEILSELPQEPSVPGYAEIGTVIFVSEDDAYRYALERIARDEGEKQEFVEWFYSGNRVKEDGEAAHI